MIVWYVANTHVNAENTAAYNLSRQGFSVYLPKYMKLRRHARRQDLVPRPLFPRYVFVGVGIKNKRWRAINSTIGINHLISFDGRPTILHSDILDQVRARENNDGMIVTRESCHFRKGDRVEIVRGALCEQTGLFDSLDDKKRVIVLLDLLGRQVRVRAPIDAVQACT